ncbi:lamin tail domain-containing protein [Hydrogenophaga sp.]|uniref:lamin tail domain-containing protein n=1 Tax=Hydrogenophaga sp. TaxID=1904254 RepID=UPI0025BB21BC|nr:lamin tail domain-containing protein [Hydrogenophaga sp.]MBT9463051.1 lamin tail domain-containing protein [Hydrogenophaga sp.]
MSLRSALSLSTVFSALVLTATAATAQVRITEVAPWSSGNSVVSADWFELTNFGNAAVNIAGWKVDDSSNAFASAINLSGVSTIGAGQSVIFIEGSAATASSFRSNWFGSPSFAGVVVGTYSGAGIGLGTGGDSLNIFNAAGALQARVDFGASDASSPFQTFDNSAGLNNVLLGTLSTAGTNGAFVIASGLEIGSPSLVPEPETYAMLLAGLGLIGAATRRRKA